ncbi:MAG: hypothetical protein KGI28_09810 [Thaumarchaeota archaeon]|nr:hypothetical protein [Nitrososphaerota archaeon]
MIKTEISRGKKLALLGVVIGVISASLASDEIMLVQAQNQKQKEIAQFEIQIVSFISGMITLISLFIRSPNSPVIQFIRSLSSSIVVTNIIFLSFLPIISSWLKL